MRHNSSDTCSIGFPLFWKIRCLPKPGRIGPPKGWEALKTLLFQASWAANPSGRGYDDQSVLRGNGDLLTHRNMRVFDRLLRQT
jgi:hypothetical protein